MYLYDFPVGKKYRYALIETSNYVLIHIYDKGNTYLFDRRDCSNFMKLKSGRYFNAFETELGLFCHSYDTVGCELVITFFLHYKYYFALSS